MKRTILLGLSVALVISCDTALGDKGKDESGKGKEGGFHEQLRHEGEDASYFERHGYKHLDIPKGHYPPPGECRIWYPGEAPGQQPPPGNCRELSSQVPPGGWLIRHPENDPRHVHVSVYEGESPMRYKSGPTPRSHERNRPPRILATGQFEIDTGTFVRVVLER